MTFAPFTHYTTRMEHYVIQGGRTGYERLLLLDRDRWPDTQALLARAGVGAGMRCLDLGCGGGQVTLELARLVAPGGTATGVDMDDVKLALAREEAVRQGITNIAFRAENVNDWDEPAAYDVVFSRYLLQHLSQPVALLRHMWAAVRPGGVLIVEDADHEGWCSYPANDGFAFYLRNFNAVIARAGGDPTAGRKLYAYFREASIPDAHVNMVGVLHRVDEGKQLALSTLDTTADAVRAADLATADEIAAARQQLVTLTNDPHSLIVGPRIFQVWARRP